MFLLAGRASYMLHYDKVPTMLNVLSYVLIVNPSGLLSLRQFMEAGPP